MEISPAKKTVLVTGAARGIGRATAELFARNGYNVLINYHASGEKAGSLCAGLAQEGFSAALFQADVTDRTAVEAMVDYCVQRFGGLDVLVNNAGLTRTTLFVDITEEEWDEILAVNLTGGYLCTRAALRHMLPKKRGKIINISSIWGLVGGACEVHYSAAKAGVIGLTKALAKELGPSGIQVNCIAPGAVETGMLAGYTEEELDELRRQTPLGRLARPEEIAACALFLASPAADFVTGQVISPNGGLVV
ncbi:MAG: SDR family oxidoreductase [Firmicutes bacterium]|nr:SDR family oxidoreductase [Bacillota bacterium]